MMALRPAICLSCQQMLDDALGGFYQLATPSGNVRYVREAAAKDHGRAPIRTMPLTAN